MELFGVLRDDLITNNTPLRYFDMSGEYVIPMNWTDRAYVTWIFNYSLQSLNFSKYILNIMVYANIGFSFVNVNATFLQWDLTEGTDLKVQDRI